MTTTVTTSPVVIIVRDGWGENPNPSHGAFNAVKLAKTPVNDRLRATYPWTLVKTSGEDVGLPDGTMGNSEVGHQNIGAGRIVEQESRVITKAMQQGFDTIPAVRKAILDSKLSATARFTFSASTPTPAFTVSSNTSTPMFALQSPRPDQGLRPSLQRRPRHRPLHRPRVRAARRE